MDLKPLYVDAPVPFVRTDFSDDDGWARVVAAATATQGLDAEEPGDFEANIEPISDPQYDGLSPAALADGAPEDYIGFVFLVDATSYASDELTVVVVDLDEEPGRSFRTVVGEVSAIEANLSLANMDFEDWADSVDGDGVFRAFAD
ncbi:MAG: hypothetical protein JWQ74_2104 [Marmoricola sp.]|nr:hypothetical protein [Marmoricola sp.]